MGSVKTWRRAALTSYIVAGAALSVAGYAWSTTQSNINAVAAAQKRLDDAQWQDHLADGSQVNAASAAGNLERLDARPYSPAVDWSAIVPRVVPSVVMVSIMALAIGDGSHDRVWLVPGVQTNLATAWLNRYRGWQQGWTETDRSRDWVTLGAGFLIGDGRQVVTAGHVLSGSEVIRVKLAGGEWRSARVVGVDLPEDVALLAIQGVPGQPVTAAPAMPPQGQEVATVGAPNGAGFSLSDGLVSRYGTAGGMFKPQRTMQISGAIADGSSGGPVFNAKGEAVGMVSFGRDSFNQAIPIDRVISVAHSMSLASAQ